MDFLCKCNNCDSFLLDTNPQVGQKLLSLDSMKLDSLESIDDMRACPKCKTDDYLNDLFGLELAKALWEMFGDIGLIEDDEIDEPFLHFEIGTDKFEIWHWFEDEFDISVAKDLMGL